MQDALAFGNPNSDKELLTAHAITHYGISYAYPFAAKPQRGYTYVPQSLADLHTNNLAHGGSNAYAALSDTRYAMGEYK